MNEDDELRRALESLMRTMLSITHGDQPAPYWHHDEDFAAFMDAVLEPVDVD